jgi:hypothetical protein
MATYLELFNYDLDQLGQIGVYSIHHIHDSSCLYIGSTCKTKKDSRKTHHGFYKRFYDHVRSLRLNVHHSKYLQNVVNKYGIEGLVFTVLEVCHDLTPDEIRTREQHYIDKFKPKYNSFDTVYPKGRSWTKEDRLKMKERMKGKSFPKHVYEKLKKPIYQLDMEGNLINMFKSKTEAASLLKIDNASISKCANGKRKSAGGYKWTYKFLLHPIEAKKMGLSVSRIQDEDCD